MFLTYYGAQALTYVSVAEVIRRSGAWTPILTAARIEPFRGVMTKDFVHIDGPLAVYGTRRVRLECLYLATFKR